MTQIRTGLRAYLLDDQDPATSLDRLDQLVVELMGDQVASALLLIIDPATGAIEMVNAGHPPPLLYGDGPARTLDGTSRPLLGLGAGSSLTVTTHLPPGATLLAYTDGLHERRSLDMTATLEQVRAAGEPGPPLTGAAGLGDWAAGLIDIVPGTRDDDVTLLAIRRPR